MPTRVTNSGVAEHQIVTYSTTETEFPQISHWYGLCTLKNVKTKPEASGFAGEMMKMKGLRKVLFTLGIGLIIAGGSAFEADAQSRREVQRERERYERAQREYERQNARRARQNRSNRVVVVDPTRGVVADQTYFPGSPRQAMNASLRQGYEQGMIAGRYDRQKKKFNNSNVYRNTPNSGDTSSSDYYHRQGYLEGYEDGYYGRRRY